jgi:hypothetical protein
MTKEEMRKAWLLRQTGWAEIRRLEIEAERQRTPNDRLKDLDAMIEFARQAGMHPRVERDIAVMERWKRLRDHYARERRNPV